MIEFNFEIKCFYYFLEKINLQKNSENDCSWTLLSDNYGKASTTLHSATAFLSDESLLLQSISNPSTNYNNLLLGKRFLCNNSDIPSKEQKLPPYRLAVIRQPEKQHRARYLSEGSRGAIKDRTGTSNCTIQVNYFF